MHLMLGTPLLDLFVALVGGCNANLLVTENRVDPIVL